MRNCAALCLNCLVPEAHVGLDNKQGFGERLPEKCILLWIEIYGELNEKRGNFRDMLFSGGRHVVCYMLWGCGTRSACTGRCRFCHCKSAVPVCRGMFPPVPAPIASQAISLEADRLWYSTQECSAL